MDGFIYNTHAFVQLSDVSKGPFWVPLPIHALRFVIRRGIVGAARLPSTSIAEDKDEDEDEDEEEEEPNDDDAIREWAWVPIRLEETLTKLRNKAMKAC